MIKTAAAWFEFTKSRTGQIDFAGKVNEPVNEGELIEAGYQKIASSSYFTPSYYIYLQDGENANPIIFVASDVDVSNTDTFDFLVHIGPLLAAKIIREAKAQKMAYQAKLSSLSYRTICVQVTV